MSYSFERRLAEELAAREPATIAFTQMSDVVSCSIDGHAPQIGGDVVEALDLALDAEPNPRRRRKP